MTTVVVRAGMVSDTRSSAGLFRAAYVTVTLSSVMDWISGRSARSALASGSEFRAISSSMVATSCSAGVAWSKFSQHC